MSDRLAEVNDWALIGIGLALGLALGLAVGLIALQVIRRRARDADADDLAARRAEVGGYRATYMDAVARAKAAGGGIDAAEVEKVDKEFAALTAALVEGTTDEVRANLVDRAEEIERRRAYVYPKQEILLQAKTSIADMVDWGVPRVTIKKIERDLMKALQEGSLEEKRAALHKVFDYYDSWSAHVEDYEEWCGSAARLLTWSLAVALVGAVVCGLWWRPLFAFLAAGLVGALASVLSRMPAMLGWKQWATYTPRILGRLASGLAGTIAGGALLLVGAVTIGADDHSFADVIAGDRITNARDMLTVLGFGVVFGFTERMLARINPFANKTSREKAEEEAPANP